MSKFQVGDRVQYAEFHDSEVGTIHEPHERYTASNPRWWILWDSGRKTHGTEGVYQFAGNMEPATPDATDPGYYKFPGGAEVRQISAHLTSFGGQALQYVARSTRLDGNNKGDRVENLRKARLFLEWEIERIEAQK